MMAQVQSEELTTLLIFWSIVFFPLLVEFVSINRYGQKGKAGTSMESTIQPSSTSSTQHGLEEHSVKSEGNSSGVTWPAVIAGAFVIAALSLILLALGTGLGLSSVSPWAGVGLSSSKIGTAAIVWMIVMQILSSSMGGYLAGRLRTKWSHIHSDEVYFRDTAHGFLAWAVALVATATFLTTAATYMVGEAASTAAGNAGNKADLQAGPNEYFVDSLFRSENVRADSDPASLNREAAGIFARSLVHENLSPVDKNYLAQLVAARTGLGQPEAQKRVSDAFASAQQAVNTAREATSHALLWIFLAVLIGAFCASYAATIGGRQRDHVVAV